jgi:hypothetical protein
VLDPEGATDEVLRLVHTEDEVRRFAAGALRPTRARHSIPHLSALGRRAFGGLTVAEEIHGGGPAGPPLLFGTSALPLRPVTRVVS